MDDVEYRRAADARNRENRARLAQVGARFTQTGEGSIEFEDAVDFGLTFVEEPYVITGHIIDIEGLRLNDDDTPDLPQVSSYVVEWDRDDRGFYVGAWCAGVVTYPVVDAGTVDGAAAQVARAQTIVRHLFTFAAIAIKDVPLDVTD